MLIETLLGFFTAPLLALLDALPIIEPISLSDWAYIAEQIKSILTGVGCLVPMLELMPIIYSIISLHVFRLVWAILLRVKSFIPLFGG